MPKYLRKEVLVQLLMKVPKANGGKWGEGGCQHLSGISASRHWGIVNLSEFAPWA